MTLRQERANAAETTVGFRIRSALSDMIPGDKDVGEMIAGLAEEMFGGGTKGKARPLTSSGHGGIVNIYPSESDEVGCAPIFVSFCKDGDKFDHYLNETLRLSHRCAGKQKRVVLVTSKWESEPWRERASHFQRLPQQVHVILITGTGVQPFW